MAKGFIKGVGTGIAAGVAVLAVGAAVMRNKKSVRKKANKAMKTVGEIIDNVQYIMK